jgi:hypothetical protein
VVNFGAGNDGAKVYASGWAGAKWLFSNGKMGFVDLVKYCIRYIFDRTLTLSESMQCSDAAKFVADNLHKASDGDLRMALTMKAANGVPFIKLLLQHAGPAGREHVSCFLRNGSHGELLEIITDIPDDETGNVRTRTLDQIIEESMAEDTRGAVGVLPAEELSPGAPGSDEAIVRQSPLSMNRVDPFGALPRSLGPVTAT